MHVACLRSSCIVWTFQYVGKGIEFLGYSIRKITCVSHLKTTSIFYGNVDKTYQMLCFESVGNLVVWIRWVLYMNFEEVSPMPIFLILLRLQTHLSY